MDVVGSCKLYEGPRVEAVSVLGGDGKCHVHSWNGHRQLPTAVNYMLLLLLRRTDQPPSIHPHPSVHLILSAFPVHSLSTAGGGGRGGNVVISG
jgi:hypothetical protein